MRVIVRKNFIWLKPLPWQEILCAARPKLQSHHHFRVSYFWPGYLHAALGHGKQRRAAISFSWRCIILARNTKPFVIPSIALVPASTQNTHEAEALQSAQRTEPRSPQDHPLWRWAELSHLAAAQKNFQDCLRPPIKLIHRVQLH